MICSTLGLLAAGKFMTNALPLEGVAEVAVLLIAGELLGTCCNLGLTAALPKLLAARPGDGADRLLAVLFPFQCAVVVVAVVLTGAAGLLGPWWLPHAGPFLPLSPAMVMLAAPLLVAITLRDFLLAAAAGRHAYGRRAGAIVLMSSLQALTFGGLFLFERPSPHHFAWAYIASATAGTILLLWGLPRPLHWDGREAGRQVRFSLPLFVNTLLGFAGQRLDTFFVAFYLGAGHVAVFEMAKRIPGVVGRFLGAGLVPYLPSVAERLRDGGTAGAGPLIQCVSAYTAFGGYLATLGVVAIQKPLLAALFTAAYQEAAPAVGPLLIATCLATQAGIMGQALIALDRPVTVMRINIGLAIIGIGLNWALVPRFGLAGAGWSAVAAGTFSLVLQRAALARAGMALARAGTFKIHGLFAVAYGSACYLDHPAVTMVIAMTYGTLCFCSGAISLVELRSLRRAEVP